MGRVLPRAMAQLIGDMDVHLAAIAEQITTIGHGLHQIGDVLQHVKGQDLLKAEWLDGDLLVAVNAGGGGERLTFNLGVGVNLREVARSSGAPGGGDPTTGVDVPARTAIIWEVVP